jgi:hypothetical protein
MTWAPVTDAAPSGDDSGPDRGDLRLRPQESHDSGIPPARERFVVAPDSHAALEQLERVLVESTRAEANLGLLLRGLRHMTAGASAAQEANGALMLELDELRHRVSRAYERESLLKRRVDSLEHALEVAGRERDAWLLQEDAFLVGLLDDHEQRLFELERAHEQRLFELERAHEHQISELERAHQGELAVSSLELQELRLQRDGARGEVARASYERDAAVALLNEPAPREAPPELSVPAVLGAVRLVKPSLRQPSEPSSRPSGGYSLRGGEVYGNELSQATYDRRSQDDDQ